MTPSPEPNFDARGAEGMRELEDKDLETALKLVTDNCRAVFVALQGGETPREQCEQITLLLMHTRELRLSLLLALKEIVKKNPDALSDKQKKEWLEKKE